MKKPLLIVFIAFSMLAAAHGQQGVPGQSLPTDAAQPAVEWKKFSIKFPGGTPGELVKTIQRQTQEPLNVIVPVQYSTFQMPPFEMVDVDVPGLFLALELASRRTENYVTGQAFPVGNSTYQTKITSYGFRSGGDPLKSTNLIWSFFVDGVPEIPATEQPVSRFYHLGRYMDVGIKVEDITTAVQTAWKMLGDQSPPQLSFHKDTRILVAVGEPRKLSTIDAVLQALNAEFAAGESREIPKRPDATH